jgi:PAS domain S-box-containing protein
MKQAFQTSRVMKESRVAGDERQTLARSNEVGIITDLTPGKGSEGELKGLLKEVIDLNLALDEHAIVATTDLQGRISYVNDKFCAISQYSREELLGQDHRIINSGFHPKEFMRDLWTTITHGKVWKGEIKNKAKDGSFYWVSATIVPILDEQGKPLQYVAIRTDITECKRTEHALRASEAHLKTVVENLNEGVVVCDLHGALQHWNRAALRIHGFTDLEDGRRILTELVDTFELSTMDGTPIPVEQWPLSRILRSENLRDLEVRVRNIKTDWQRVFSYSGTLVHDAEDQPVLAIVTINDITERKEAEEALQRQEKQYRVLFETYPSPTWVYDAETLAFLAVNDAAVQQYGYSREEFLAMTIQDIRRSGGIPDSIEPGTVTSNDAEVAGVWRHRKKGGEIILADIHASAIQFEGRLAHLSIALDVTEKKKAEDAMRESEERMRSVLESALDCVITMDHEGRVVEFNPAAEKAFGYKRDEAIGQVLADLIVPPALRERHQRGLAHYLSTGEAPVLGKRVELTGMRSDKSEFPLELALTRIGSQEPPMFTGFIRDITERKQAEERLREQAKLLDLAQDAIMVRDMEDRVEFWNHGAEKLYGWTAAEVHCKKASGFFYEGVPAAAAAARVAVIENGKWTGECKHTCKDGGTVMVRSRWTLVRDELAAPKSILIINTDITEQKKVEEQFLRAQRLESIGTLASGVAHDLNNILVPILMAAPLLRDDMPAEEREKLLAIVEASAERGASIVKQVLTFARGADGDRVLLQPIYLVQEVAKIAEKTFPKSVAVHTHYPEDLWTIVANATQLQQVLLNLCINARDAMPTGGTLTLALENFEVDDHCASMTPGAKAGPHVLLEVKDTGTGIPRDIIDKIFDPFFTTKELGQGTGLGLSTVIGIVKGHGGFMDVESSLGRGTSFKVFLPANITELAAAPTSEAAPLPPANGELLLIVDDERPILQVAQALLENHGYRVLTAADATEALAIFALRMNEIALVLTDLAMPFMDGVALIRTLQRMKPDVRVIASSGRGSQEGRANDFAALNVRACLTKPYNKNKLLVTLHDVLSHASDNQ